MAQLSRRDFLKIAGTTFASIIATKGLLSQKSANNQKPNIIIVLCDAFSAAHLSLFGYPRLTTPNIDAFAEHSTVFYNHYSCGNFTTTGTATMLTGMIPWKHRAINYGGLVRSEFVGTNPFTLLGSDYHRFAFSQNIWPDYLLGQYSQDVDRFLSLYSYSLVKDSGITQMFENDHALASIALNDFLIPVEDEDGIPAGSPVMGYLDKIKVLKASGQKFARYIGGVPEAMSRIPYLNEEIYSGVYSELLRLEAETSPYFAYFHLMSPHSPYKPRNDFRKLFTNDGYVPVSKPIHPYSSGFDEKYLSSRRITYDRQIAQIDHEFGRLIENLAKNGILDNSYFIFTSDHGELFERGFSGHGNRFMYEPVLRVPLIIHAPGQTKREDVLALTSNIDILPTLLAIAGKNTVPDIDGKVLPGFGGQADEDRPIFSIVAADNSAFKPITQAVITMHRHKYKLISYLGYDDIDPNFELYNLENDPDELNNLVLKDTRTLSVMKSEFFAYLHEANTAFEKLTS